jgi:two-component system, chemotaxis family, response regulator Rcp1
VASKLLQKSKILGDEMDAYSYTHRDVDSTSAKRSVKILSVEDNSADAGLLKFYFDRCQIAVELFAVENGDAALEFLTDQDRNGSRLPDLILLDLNLPNRNGKEVLRHIKGSDALKHIPVLILTTSNNQEDICECYGIGANGFISKPVDLNSFETVIKSIELFWLTVVHLPSLPSEKHSGGELFPSEQLKMA